MNRAQRRQLRKAGYTGPLEATVPEKSTIAHGVCRICGRRTWLMLPVRYCERDLLAVAQANGELFNEGAFGGVLGGAELPPEVPYDRELALAELDRMEAEL